jgi:PadR family transcriptional regulator, regulatory protein PadR
MTIAYIGRMCGRARDSRSDCRCSCEVRGFIQPRLLLLLARKAAHGYELMEALRSIPGAESLADPGMLYRALRQLEEIGAVRSVWDTEGRGPARRVYRLTKVGQEHLEAWVAEIRSTRTHLEGFLEEYASLAETHAVRRRKRG